MTLIAIISNIVVIVFFSYMLITQPFEPNNFRDWFMLVCVFCFPVINIIALLSVSIKDHNSKITSIFLPIIFLNTVIKRKYLDELNKIADLESKRLKNDKT